MHTEQRQHTEPGIKSASSTSGQPLSGAETAPVTAGNEPVAATPSAAAPAAEDVRQYRMGLAVNARRYKRYPSLAREAGWEGIVEIAVILLRSQAMPEVSLVRSSGRPILDEEALLMISKASAVTKIPDVLKGRDLRVLLPVEFALEGER